MPRYHVDGLGELHSGALPLLAEELMERRQLPPAETLTVIVGSDGACTDWVKRKATGVNAGDAIN